MQQITNIDDRRIDQYRSLRFTPIEHTSEHIFIAEGFKCVDRLLRSKIQVVSIFAEQKYFDHFSAIIESKGITDDSLYVASKDIMNQIVGFKLHSGVMAIARQPDFTSLSELKPPIVALNGIVDSENVGSIVRNCAAFGIESLLYDIGSSSPYLRRAVRVSMGSVMSMNIAFSHNLIASIDELHLMGYTIVAAETGTNVVSLSDYTFPAKTIVLLGSEGRGIAKEILDQADAIVEIPFNSQNISSLNVSAASAIILYKLAMDNGLTHII